MEAATTASTEEERSEQPASSFAKSLFLRRDPRGDGLPVAAARRGRAGARSAALNAAAREIGERIDHRKIEEERWIGDDVIRELGERRAVRPLRRPSSTAARASRRPATRGSSRPSPRSTRRCRSSWASTSRSASRASTCSAPTSRRSASSPTSPAGRKLAGFALTEPNAGSDAYNIESRAVQQPDGSWVLNGEKRYIGNGSQGLGLHHLRALRGRRQGPPHRADPREGDEGLRGRRALRHDGPARQRPAPPLLQRRPGPARERARRARRGLPDRDADPQQRPDRPRHRLGRRRQAASSTWRSTTSRSAASSASRWPTSSSSRTRSAGWSPTCSGSSRCAT